MELYCRRCTRAETIKGDMEAAKSAGWQVDSWPEGDQFVCPRCPAIRTKPQLSIEETYLAAGQILHDLSSKASDSQSTLSNI